MSELQPSTIQFTLNESVWFAREQAVDELISISLHPYINILDEEDFIIIKGALQLDGEYRRQTDPFINDQLPNEQIFVQDIRLVDEDDHQFSHRFPVDITIPKRKIERIEDIAMTIESFDYEIKDNQMLKIIADIEIEGIVDAQESSIIRNEQLIEDENDGSKDEVEIELELEREEEIVEEENEDEEEIPLTVIKRNESALKEIEIEEVITVEAEKEVIQDIQVEQEIEEIPSEQVAREPEVVEEKGELVEQVVESVEKTAIPILREEDYLTDKNEPIIIENSRESPAMNEEEFVELESSSDQFIQESSSHVEQKKKKKIGSTVTMSFAEFFSRKEEKPAKMKICVVQENDSLETIADRYNVSTQQLVRANNLHVTDHIVEGQLLDIPFKAQAKKQK